MASTVFYNQVAQFILTQHAREVPDLRKLIVLLPNYHVAQSFAQALAKEANQPALLLPRMVTLNDWVKSIPLAAAVVPDTCRAATLYQALRDRQWFADADLWGIASELLTLLDELTQHHVTLPQNEDDFLEQLEHAYQSKRNAAMQFEARVVHELWYAMSANGELDAARANLFRLSALAQQADTPLVVLLTSALSAPETQFLKTYAEQAPVKIFNLCDMIIQEASCAVLQTLTLTRQQENVSHSSLRNQAQYLREHFPRAAFNRPATELKQTARKLTLYSAHSLEQEAQAAEVQVRRWLLAGKKSIAIVAQDRLVARRVRALLERAEVLISDESGWVMSTLSVSTVLMRWLDALQSNFYYQDLLDLLKSPFIFADQNPDDRKQAVYQLEQRVRKQGVASHLEAFIELTRGENEVQVALVKLRQAAESLQKNSDSLSGWLCALNDSLVILGIVQGLQADVAGVQLLQSLQTWQQELTNDATRFTRTEWRHWLALQLDAHTFRDTAIDSPVLLTHLAATRWRSFDAVLILGADSLHLPSQNSDSLWFNDTVRSTLGLPTRESHLTQQRDDLLALLAMNDTLLVTWQASKSGEKNLLSPYLEMLRALHELAYDDDLTEHELGSLLKHAEVCGDHFPLPDITVMPTPSVPANLIPKRISASGYNSLVACPYQYYARHILRLNEMDEVREGIEKRDYGEWVHDILHRFHQQFNVLGDHTQLVLENALQRISNEVFAPTLEHDFIARAWLLRWQQAIPAYLESQLKSETEGWHYQNGEVPFELPLTDELTFHGRIDRIDVQTNGTVRVLDYKMMEATRLRGKLKEAGEDVQLACYAHVYEAEEAAFLSIEKDKVIAVAPPQDIPQLAGANIERLTELFTQMRNGVPLPAHGINEICGYCEMRGLCRKNE